MEPGTFRITVERDSVPDKDGKVRFTLEWWPRSPDAHGRTYKAQHFFADPESMRYRFAMDCFTEVK